MASSDIMANVVFLFHVLFVIWAVVVPFTNNEPMLVLHMITMPFLWLHWWIHDDTCALTLMERYLRGVESKESFFHNLVSPVYKIEDTEMRQVSWLVSIVLWLITMSKVLARPAMIKEVMMPWTTIPKPIDDV